MTGPQPPAERFIGPIAYIQALVAEYHELTIADLVGPQRIERIVKPRQLAMYIANRVCRRSAAEIGRRFGGRDHTTVLYAVRCVELRIAKDPETAAAVEELVATLALRFQVSPAITKTIEAASELVARQLAADLTILARYNPAGLFRALRRAAAEVEEFPSASASQRKSPPTAATTNFADRLPPRSRSG